MREAEGKIWLFWSNFLTMLKLGHSAEFEYWRVQNLITQVVTAIHQMNVG